jgi:transposase
VTLIGVRKGLMDAIHHPETMPKKAAQRLRRPLQLSDEQTRRIEQILRDRQQTLQQIRTRVQPEVDAELDIIDREISQVLDEAQRAKWQKLFQQLRSTWLPPPPASTAPATSP